ncbi:MAG: tyrosine-type recombinase/integrase [Pyrinomonadaceae bacterium]|nr:tyrosine-type recombinase/integrase [Pyrinomonadaceae bacterium]
MRKEELWKHSAEGLYRYQPTGIYFARIRFGGKLYRRSLDTTDKTLAKRKLADFRNDLERTDARAGKTTFAAVLDSFEATLGHLAPGTQKNKRAIIAKLRATYFGIDALPLRHIRPSDVAGWLARHCSSGSAAYYNDALSTIRQALDLAVDDKIIAESPAAKLKYRKRSKPIRQTPTFEQFQAIIASIRAQPFNRERDDSGDFVEFMGLSGLGQAEMASLVRSDVDLDAGRITVFRHKTSKGFVIPIFPQLRPLVERLCEGKAHDDGLFPIYEARKALANACQRLGFPLFSHRSLRRMFIVRCIEKGIDVKLISKWQGHSDGGKLILSTYSHINQPHEQRMAQLMSTSEPEHVVPFMAKAELAECRLP